MTIPKATEMSLRLQSKALGLDGSMDKLAERDRNRIWTLIQLGMTAGAVQELRGKLEAFWWGDRELIWLFSDWFRRNTAQDALQILQ